MNEQEFRDKNIWNDGYAYGKREQYDNTITIIRKMIDDAYIEINKISGCALKPILKRDDPTILPVMNVLIKKLEEDFGWEDNDEE